MKNKPVAIYLRKRYNECIYLNKLPASFVTLNGKVALSTCIIAIRHYRIELYTAFLSMISLSLEQLCGLPAIDFSFIEMEILTATYKRLIIKSQSTRDKRRGKKTFT